MSMSYKGVVPALFGVLLGLLAGCSPAKEAVVPSDDAPVREAFAAFQAALKAEDADKLWALLDSDSQADAERAAKAIQAEYHKAGPEARAEQEKSLGLVAKELDSLDGKGFLKSLRFKGKYDEVPDGKIEKVTVQGERATVAYVEPDGDHEKLTLVRQDSQWRVSVPMPRATAP
jgi:hypothetical protein